MDNDGLQTHSSVGRVRAIGRVALASVRSHGAPIARARRKVISARHAGQRRRGEHEDGFGDAIATWSRTGGTGTSSLLVEPFGSWSEHSSGARARLPSRSSDADIATLTGRRAARRVLLALARSDFDGASDIAARAAPQPCSRIGAAALRSTWNARAQLRPRHSGGLGAHARVMIIADERISERLGDRGSVPHHVAQLPGARRSLHGLGLRAGASCKATRRNARGATSVNLRKTVASFPIADGPPTKPSAAPRNLVRARQPRVSGARGSSSTRRA